MLFLSGIMESHERACLEKAGHIAAQAVAYGRSVVKKGMLLRELAEDIEKKIVALGGKPAFPVNLSINEVAAHATPSYDSDEKAHGLLKVDIGVHVEGWIADTAFSVDLDGNELHTRLIHAAEHALEAAVDVAKNGVALRVIGAAVEESITGHGFVPVHNLSGHGIEQHDVHAGLTVPNYDNGSSAILEEGVYAIEPFSTNGHGRVRDGKPSGIYQLVKAGAVRDAVAREVLVFIDENYQTLPFCSRWIHAHFGVRGLLALRILEQAGVLHHFAQLIEVSGGVVAQAEHTLIVDKKGVKVTTHII